MSTCATCKYSYMTLKKKKVSALPVGSSPLGGFDPQDDKIPECLYQASPEAEQ